MIVPIQPGASGSPLVDKSWFFKYFYVNKGAKMRGYIKWIVLIFILLFFITFGVKNSQPVFLNYYFNIQDLQLPLYALAYICILVGIFVGMVVGILDRFSLRKRIKKLEKEKKALDQKLSEMEKEKEAEKREEETSI